MIPLAHYLALSAAFTVTGCILGGSGGNSGFGPEPAGDITDVFAYRTEGEVLIKSWEGGTIRYCIGDSLRNGSYPAGEDTLPIERRGDTLRVTLDEWTSEMGGRARLRATWIRIGHGSGIEGDWKVLATRVETVSGAFTQVESARHAEIDKSNSFQAEYETVHHRFRDGRKTTYSDEDVARYFIDAWNGKVDLPDDAHLDPDSGKYAITLRALDKRTLEYKGHLNGETVLRHFPRLGSNALSSDHPGHAPYSVPAKPIACPDPEIPDWWEDFFDANRRPADE